ncbi:DNA polymerase ligase N-terminal domain-containing protein [Anaerosoma tenue]|uniref:DNA polymerase ligase N-terminal domain-containing protein n=1 Tax=Anaerosoma tenue TaxID=2933588 RepID=UPI002B26C763|nr:DNA polymerase ligase N-terminal domain-containing protein [Anaerosoma tenue]
MSLDDYNEKRHFGHTPEPAGSAGRSGEGPAGGLRFVVQKHDASQLHYDFRLEWDGVLLSWAVPKGPSLDPKDKRLAVEVEDHPVDYADFEGVIPEDEYGGGTVMVWDRGTYEPRGDMAEMRADGSIKVDMRGEKLRGGFALVRMKRREGEKRDNWLLIKERDDEARPRDSYDVLAEEPGSAKTGRSMEEIAAEA